MNQIRRADAQENRDRVLEAARRLFSIDGLETTMRQIAREAGVGPATLYRHFPTKHHLVLAAFQDELGACAAIVEEGVADPDPWLGFCTVVERLLLLHSRNQGFTDAFIAGHRDLVDFSQHRRRLSRQVAGIARSAHQAGRLRPDFTFDDFVLILLAARGLHAVADPERDAAVRRFATVVLAGLANSGHPAHPPPGTEVAGVSARQAVHVGPLG